MIVSPLLLCLLPLPNVVSEGDDLEEAKRLQKEQRAAQALEDFDFDPTPVAKSSQVCLLHFCFCFGLFIYYVNIDFKILC